MNVLMAPASDWYFTKRRGGIYSISYNLVTLLSQYVENIHIIVNNIDTTVHVPKNVQIYIMGKQDIERANIRDRIFFSWRYYKCVKDILEKYKINIIHHLSLFIYGKSYNLFSIFERDDYPLIIGPAEMPHEFFEDDYILLRGKNHKVIKLEFKLIKKFKKAHELLVYPMFEKTLDKSDVVIVVNERTKKEYKKIISNKKIKVIPVGVDKETFPFSQPPLNHEILAVGVNIKRKGFDYLINAMPKILKEYPDARLHITGGGPRESSLIKLARRLGVKQHVMFHGYINDEKLVKLYKRCRLFCHPSLSESFCHTILEAMAAGRPVVSTSTVGSEMVEDGKTGFIVPFKDSEAIAEAILKIFSDEGLTYKMGVRARNIVEKKYDWNIIAKRYYKIYQELI